MGFFSGIKKAAKGVQKTVRETAKQVSVGTPFQGVVTAASKATYRDPAGSAKRIAKEAPALAVQAGLAYATGGASLATSFQGMASNLPGALASNLARDAGDIATGALGEMGIPPELTSQAIAMVQSGQAPTAEQAAAMLLGQSQTRTQGAKVGRAPTQQAIAARSVGENTTAARGGFGGVAPSAPAQGAPRKGLIQAILEAFGLG